MTSDSPLTVPAWAIQEGRALSWLLLYFVPLHTPATWGGFSVLRELLKQRQICTTILITLRPKPTVLHSPLSSFKEKKKYKPKPDNSGKVETLKLFYCCILCLRHPSLSCFSPCSQHRVIWEDVCTTIQILLFAFVSVFLSFLSFFLQSSAYFVLAYGIMFFKPITVNVVCC